MTELNELHTLAHARKFTALEDAWMTLMQDLPGQVDELIAVIAWLVKVKERDRAQLYMAMLLDALSQQRPGEPALAVCYQAIAWFPEEESFRVCAAEQFAHAHKDHPYAAAIAARAGMRTSRPLDAVLGDIELRLPVVPGAYAIHRRRRIPVRIVEYSAADDKLVMTDGTAPFASNLATFYDQYEWLANDDFRALRVFEPGRLAAIARENPAELVIMHLKTCGRESVFRDFKDAVTGAIIPPGEWKEWWQGAKAAVLQHPLIECGQGSQPSLKLRETARNSDTVRQTEFDHAGPRRKAALMLGYLAEVRNGLPLNEGLCAEFTAALARQAGVEGEPVTALCSWLALRAAADVRPAEIPAYHAGWLEAPAAQRSFAFACGWEALLIEPFITFIPGVEPGWQERFAGVLPCAPYALAEQLVKALRAAGASSLVGGALEKVVSPEPGTAETFAWLWAAVVGGAPPPELPPQDDVALTLTLLAAVQQASVQREHSEQNLHQTLATLRHTVSLKRYELIRSVFQKLSPEQTATLFYSISANTGLSSPMRSQLMQMIGKTAGATA